MTLCPVGLGDRVGMAGWAAWGQGAGMAPKDGPWAARGHMGHGWDGDAGGWSRDSQGCRAWGWGRGSLLQQCCPSTQTQLWFTCSVNLSLWAFEAVVREQRQCAVPPLGPTVPPGPCPHSCPTHPTISGNVTEKCLLGKDAPFVFNISTVP